MLTIWVKNCETKFPCWPCISNGIISLVNSPFDVNICFQVSIISCIEPATPKVTNYAPFISNPIIRANLLLLEFGPHVLCNLAIVGSENENQFRWITIKCTRHSLSILIYLLSDSLADNPTFSCRISSIVYGKNIHEQHQKRITRHRISFSSPGFSFLFISSLSRHISKQEISSKFFIINPKAPYRVIKSLYYQIDSRLNT